MRLKDKMRSRYFKNGGKLDRLVFDKIHRAVNTLIAEHVVEGEDVSLPYNMGYLGVTRQKLGLVHTAIGPRPRKVINWIATHEEWKRNPESKKKGILIYLDFDYLYKVELRQAEYGPTKLKYFDFNISDKAKHKLARNIKEGVVTYAPPTYKSRMYGEQEH